MRRVVSTPGAEQSGTGVSLTALTERIHSDGAIPPGRKCFLLMDHHTGRHHGSQERRAMLDKRERSQRRTRGLDVVDRWIALRRWPSGRRGSVSTQK